MSKNTKSQAADFVIDNVGDGLETLVTDVSIYYNPEIDGRLVGFQGIVLERRERPADPRRPEKAPEKYYILKATRRTVAKNGDKETVQVNVGDLLWVDERAAYSKIADFLPYEKNGEIMAVEFAFMPTEKVSIGGGKTLWKGASSATVRGPREHGLGAIAVVKKQHEAHSLAAE